MRESPVDLGDGADVGHDRPVDAPGHETLHLLQHGGDLVGLHVRVERHAQLGAARVGDSDRGADVLVGHLVLVAPPAPAARPHVDGVGAVRDRPFDHRKISCRRQKLDHDLPPRPAYDSGARDGRKGPERFRPKPLVVHSALAEVEPVAETDPGVTPERLPRPLVHVAVAGDRPLQSRAIHRRDLAPVFGTLREGFDPEEPVPLGEQSRQVLEHAHVLAAQDSLPQRLHRPVPLLQEELLLAEIGALDAPLLLVLQKEAVVRDAERHLAVHEELQGRAAGRRDLVDLVQAQLVVRREPHRPEPAQDFGAGRGVDVRKAPDVHRKLRELLVGDPQDPEVVDFDRLGARRGRRLQHLPHLRQEVVPRRRIRRHVGPFPLIAKDVEPLLEIAELLEEVRLRRAGSRCRRGRPRRSRVRSDARRSRRFAIVVFSSNPFMTSVPSHRPTTAHAAGKPAGGARTRPEASGRRSRHGSGGRAAPAGPPEGFAPAASGRPRPLRRRLRHPRSG